MGLTAQAAFWFLPAVIPIAIYVSWSDMSAMKIPNKAVYALVISYAVLGLIALPVQTYLWQWSHLIVMLVVGILLNAARVMGAGDAKFIAAAAPMFALSDLRFVLILFAACLLGGFATHRLARYTPLHKAVPDWDSWKTGKRFPMGFPLSMTLVFYLVLVAVYR
ncbi:prepilin peptidase [Yoonia sp.]|uniref:prepilin peptidase n=1 Tax=Yoonia sp. TaxID=2212373 RepID=UPI0025DE697B|nr:prepilin peptidase [Yoonia sp.]